jgi:hypothetical protein
MALSSVTVVSNALRLRRFRPWSSGGRVVLETAAEPASAS